MEGRCGFSEGFPEGKSEGWNGARDPCLGMGRSPIPSRGLSRGKSLRKPTPSRHWLIRITFYIALPLGDRMDSLECHVVRVSMIECIISHYCMITKRDVYVKFTDIVTSIDAVTLSRSDIVTLSCSDI